MVCSADDMVAGEKGAGCGEQVGWGVVAGEKRAGCGEQVGWAVVAGEKGAGCGITARGEVWR